MRPPVLAAVLTGILSSTAASAAAPFDKVMIVVLENTSYEDAAKQPFLSSLATRGALLTNLMAEAHPSQPNYLALIAGSTFGVRSNANVAIDESHVGDLFESKALQWKVYAEDYPGNCFLGERSGLYARKHVPFLSFRSVQSDPSRCGRVVDASVLADDVARGTLPTYSLYIPNLNNDGHDTDVAYADHWLATNLGPLLAQPKFMKGMLVIVTFDEDKRSPLVQSANRVFTVLIGAGVRPGSRSRLLYSHYSILRTIEDAFGLGSLGRLDATAPISGVWR